MKSLLCAALLALLHSAEGLALSRGPCHTARSRACAVAVIDVNALDKQTLAGVGAALAVGVGAIAFSSSKKEEPAAVAAPPPPPPAPKPPAKPRKKIWKSLGGKAAIHRGAGRWPKEPARELWTPPEGWTPPTKPVTSWYDMGLRLLPPTPEPESTDLVASVKGFFSGLKFKTKTKLKVWKSLGGGSGPHRMAGRLPPGGYGSMKAMPEPLPAAAPAPASAVPSWYDSGVRL